MNSIENFIVLLVGASGTGKTTIANILQEDYGWKMVESYTTRPERYPGEKGHIFLSDADFDKLKNDICAYTEFDGYRYCATNRQVDKAQIYVIDPAGVENFRTLYKGSKNFVVVEIYASKRIRRKRMLERGDSKESVKQRLKHDKRAFKGFDGDIILNSGKYEAEHLAHQIYLNSSLFKRM